MNYLVERRCVRSTVGIVASPVVFELGVLTVLIAGLPPSMCSAKGTEQDPASQGFRPIDPGVEYLQIIRRRKSETESTGPRVIVLLRVDIRQVDLSDIWSRIGDGVIL